MTSKTPVAGPLFRRVASMEIEGAKRRRLLATIAAYADAGEHSPPIRELMVRANLGPASPRRDRHKSVRHVDHLLKRLEADGLLEVEWSPRNPIRNRYRVIA